MQTSSNEKLMNDKPSLPNENLETILTTASFFRYQWNDDISEGIQIASWGSSRVKLEQFSKTVTKWRDCRFLVKNHSCNMDQKCRLPWLIKDHWLTYHFHLDTQIVVRWSLSVISE